MAPKIKVTKKDIIETALMLIRRDGEGAINARSIASMLGCSTQPVFSNFDTMEELREATIAFAYEIYLDFIKREVESGRYPQYKSFGMAYVRFAKEEKELFKLLFMRDRTGEDISYSPPDFEESVQMIMKTNGVTVDVARLMHMEIWTCVHGIGTMLATSFLTLEWELISNMLTDVYQGIRARHLSGGN
jgi:AcrR family transcriptional regulator